VRRFSRRSARSVTPWNRLRVTSKVFFLYCCCLS
jgi:hypothetical protein